MAKTSKRDLEDTYRLVFHAILEGRIRPNTHVTRDYLKGQFGNGKMSNAAATYAIDRLKSEGVLLEKPNIGLCLHDVRDTSVRGWIIARQAMESLCVVTLIHRSRTGNNDTANIVSRLTRLNTSMKAMVTKNNVPISSRASFLNIDAEFHAKIASQAGLGPLFHHLSCKAFYAAACSAAVGAASLPVEGVIAEHSAIIKAIREEDPHGAVTAVAEHITMSCKRWFPEITTFIADGGQCVFSALAGSLAKSDQKRRLNDSQYFL